MAITVVVHIHNSDPIVGEIEEMPDVAAQYITLTNPRARDGKSIMYIDAQATRVVFPWSRISFLETMPSDEEEAEIESFFRD